MKKLNILVTPMNSIGHINACRGSTTKLIAHGHRVVFVVEQAWKGTLSPFGFEEYLFTVPSQQGKRPADEMAKLLRDVGLIGNFTTQEKNEGFYRYLKSDYVLEEWTHYDAAIKKAIEEVKPDVIIADECSLMPSCYWAKNIPWIRLISANPCFFVVEDDLPPGGSGLPFDDQSKWKEFQLLRKETSQSKSYNDFIETLGYPRFPDDARTPKNAILTAYGTPEEWNYPPLQIRPNWINLEVFNKNESNELIDLKKLLPVEFLNNDLNGKFTGKYIYVSLGSMGAVDLDLMKRLLAPLAKTNHKYIVSKGPFHDRYEVAGPNQWGDRYLPQTSIVPQVDLVITHGGNNTITEVFAHGKPMIVLPLFGDQFNNAQRLHETGFGVRLDTYNFTENELIDAVDKLLGDRVLKHKLDAARKRIQDTDQMEAFACKIEELLN